MTTIIASNAGFGNHFPHGLLVDLFDALIGEFRIAFTGLNGCMAKQVLNRDDFGPSFE